MASSVCICQMFLFQRFASFTHILSPSEQKCRPEQKHRDATVWKIVNHVGPNRSIGLQNIKILFNSSRPELKRRVVKYVVILSISFVCLVLLAVYNQFVLSGHEFVKIVQYYSAQTQEKVKFRKLHYFASFDIILM